MFTLRTLIANRRVRRAQRRDDAVLQFIMRERLAALSPVQLAVNEVMAPVEGTYPDGRRTLRSH